MVQALKISTEQQSGILILEKECITMKQRALLCLLLCGMMLYFAIPRIDIMALGSFGVFSSMWLLLAFFVVAGNLSGLLYSPQNRKVVKQEETMVKKRRMYQS
jgi:hypothetical protein